MKVCGENTVSEIKNSESENLERIGRFKGVLLIILMLCIEFGVHNDLKIVLIDPTL